MMVGKRPSGDSEDARFASRMKPRPRMSSFLMGRAPDGWACAMPVRAKSKVLHRTGGTPRSRGMSFNDEVEQSVSALWRDRRGDGGLQLRPTNVRQLLAHEPRVRYARGESMRRTKCSLCSKLVWASNAEVKRIRGDFSRYRCAGCVRRYREGME